MPKVAIVYHSGFGHTKVIAESIGAGAAKVVGVETALLAVAELPYVAPDQPLPASWRTLDEADAIVFGCPTYMGSVSADFKRFMESSSAVWSRQGWRDKLAAGFTNAGGLAGDKLNAMTDLAVFAAQHSMIWVSQGVFMDDEHNRLGTWLGLETRAEDGPPETTPPPEDHATAQKFGERIAHATLRWAAGVATKV